MAERTETLAFILEVQRGAATRELKSFAREASAQIDQQVAGQERARRALENYNRTFAGGLSVQQKAQRALEQYNRTFTRTPRRVTTDVGVRGGAEALRILTGIRSSAEGLPSRRRILIDVPRGALAVLQAYDDGLTRVGRVAGRVTGLIGIGAGAGLVGAVTSFSRQGRTFNDTLAGSEIALRNIIANTNKYEGRMGAAKQRTDELLESLTAMSERTPFSFQDIVVQAQRLLAYGIPLKDLNTTLRAMATATAAAGGSPEVMSQITLAFGQMQTKGKLMQEELRQLASAGVPAFKILREELGLTQEEMGKITELGITAEVGIPALVRGIQRRLGKTLEEQSRTRRGLESTLKDVTARLAGDLMRPFDAWEADGFRRLIPAVKRIQRRFRSDPELSIEQKLEIAWEEIAKTGVPTEVRSALADGFSLAGRLAAKGLWEGFKAAPVWAQVATGAFLAARLSRGLAPLGRVLARTAAGSAAAGRGGVVSRTAGALGAQPVLVVNWPPGMLVPGGGPGGVGPAGAGAGGRAGGLLARLAPRTAAGGLALGAGLIQGGMLLDSADKKFGLLGPSAEEARRRTREIQEEMVKAWRSGVPALRREFGNTSAMFGPIGVARVAARGQIDAMVAGMAEAIQKGKGPTRKSLRSLIDESVDILAELPPHTRRLGADSIIAMVSGLESKGELPKRSTAQLIRALEGRIGELPPATKALAQTAGENFAALVPPARKAARGVSGAIASLQRSVGAGLTAIGEGVSGFAKSLGVGSFSIKIPKGLREAAGAAADALGFADGGRIPGMPRGDHVPLIGRGGQLLGIADGGELVVNQHTERRVNAHLAQFGTSLGREVANERAPHYALGGRTPGGSDSFSGMTGMQAGIRALYAQLVRAVPGPQYVLSGFRPGSRIAGSGRVSLHASGNAVDISSRTGSGLGGSGVVAPDLDRVAMLARQALGHSPVVGGVTSNERGEVLWRTMVGGNHYDHVHVGLKGVAGKVAAAAAQKLGIPGITGPRGALAQIGQQAMRRATQVANRRLEALQARGGVGTVTGSAALDLAARAGGPALAIGQRMAAARGWVGAQWQALKTLWQGESGWNPLAHNPSSGAHGIPQSLPGSKMASAGADWETNPATQIRWGLGYIAGRYGDPVRALAAWQSRSPHWYAAGGRLGDQAGPVPYDQTVGLSTAGTAVQKLSEQVERFLAGVGINSDARTIRRQPGLKDAGAYTYGQGTDIVLGRHAALGAARLASGRPTSLDAASALLHEHLHDTPSSFSRDEGTVEAVAQYLAPRFLRRSFSRQVADRTMRKIGFFEGPYQDQVKRVRQDVAKQLGLKPEERYEDGSRGLSDLQSEQVSLALLRRLQAAGASRGARLPFAGVFGHGGVVTASSPTALVIGDRGRETAVMVPHLARGGRTLGDEASAFATGLAGGRGPKELERLLEKVMDALSKALEDYQSASDRALARARRLGIAEGSPQMAQVQANALGGRTNELASVQRTLARSVTTARGKGRAGLANQLEEQLDQVRDQVADALVQTMDAQVSLVQARLERARSAGGSLVNRRGLLDQIRGLEVDSARYLENQVVSQTRALRLLVGERARIRRTQQTARAAGNMGLVRRLDAELGPLQDEILSARVDRLGTQRSVRTTRAEQRRARIEGVRERAGALISRVGEFASGLVSRADVRSRIQGAGDVDTLAARASAQDQGLGAMQGAYDQLVGQFSQQRAARAPRAVLQALLGQIQAAQQAVESARADRVDTGRQIQVAMQEAAAAARQAIVDGIGQQADRIRAAGSLIGQDADIIGLRQRLAGVDLDSIGRMRDRQGGTLTSSQVAQARSSVAAINSTLGQQISSYQAESDYLAGSIVNPTLTADERTGYEARLREVTAALLQLQLTIKGNNESLTELTEATTDNTDATKKFTGTVSYSYRGQSYVLDDVRSSSDRLVDLEAGL